MRLKEDEYLSFKKIAKVLTKFTVKERGNLKVTVELGPEIFNDVMCEQMAQCSFRDGGIIETVKDKIVFYSTCPCEIKRNYHLENREVKFKVTRYINEYMDVKYEDL